MAKRRSTALDRTLRGNRGTRGGRSRGATGGGAPQTQLQQAVKKIGSLENAKTRAKEAAQRASGEVISVAETQGTMFAAGLAEGGLGAARMKLGPVDLRLAGGLLLQGIGVARAMGGKKDAHHFTNVGNGLAGAAIVSMGVRAGAKLRERWASKEALSGDDVGGEHREITPDDVPAPPDIAGRRKRRGFKVHTSPEPARRRKRSRFLKAGRV